MGVLQAGLGCCSCVGDVTVISSLFEHHLQQLGDVSIILAYQNSLFGILILHVFSDPCKFAG